jgi:hypothetical protein
MAMNVDANLTIHFDQALRQFAKASGILAKTIGSARMIASFLAIMPTRPAQRQTPMIEQLAAMLTVRRQLSEQKVATENASP